MLSVDVDRNEGTGRTLAQNYDPISQSNVETNGGIQLDSIYKDDNLHSGNATVPLNDRNLVARSCIETSVQFDSVDGAALTLSKT